MNPYPVAELMHFCNISVKKCTNMLNYILFELMGTASAETPNSHVAHILKMIDSHISDKVTLHTSAKACIYPNNTFLPCSKRKRVKH